MTYQPKTTAIDRASIVGAVTVNLHSNLLRLVMEDLNNAEEEIIQFGAVAIHIVPGIDGMGEEVPSTPESLKWRIEELQGEWDDAEVASGNERRAKEKAEAAVRVLKEEVLRLRAGLGSTAERMIIAETKVDMREAEVKRFRAEIERLTMLFAEERKETREALITLEAEMERLKATIEPVRDWYDGDGESDDVVAMLKAAIEDLQSNRAEVLQLRKDLARFQRWPDIDEARASAIIMQQAAKAARKGAQVNAKAIQEAVDLWSSYTTRILAERDALRLEADTAKEMLEVAAELMKEECEHDWPDWVGSSNETGMVFAGVHQRICSKCKIVETL